MATFNVSNQSGLISALKSANGGDTIKLAGGNYGRVELNGRGSSDLKFSSNVTITSADDRNPAVFDKFSLLFSKNITLDSLVFDYSAKSGTSKPFEISKSSNVTIRDSDFKGELSGGYGTGYGLYMVESTNLVLENTTFDDFFRTSHFRSVDGLKILNNEFTDSADDAMFLGRVQNVLIQGNTVDHKGRPGLLHKDAIQFFNTGDNVPSKNIVIRDNYLRTDDGIAHGIFMGNEVADRTGADNARYVNVLIENNTIVTGQALGIAVGQVDGLVVRNNVVMQNPDMDSQKAVNIPVIRFQQDSENVTITGNTTHRTPEAAGKNWQPVNDSDSSWKISANKIVGLGGTAPKAPPATDKAPSPAAPTVPESAPVKPTEPTKPPVDVDVSGNGKADTFRIDGDDRSKTISGLDFDEGDRIILINYDRDTIQHEKGGNTLWRSLDGTYAVIDSVADLQELASASPAVSLRSASDGALVKTIDQKWGDQQIIINGSGANGASGAAKTSAPAAQPEIKTAAAPAAAVQKAASGVSGNGKADTFRIDGNDRSETISALDFDEGDRIVLIKYDRNTIQHDNGGNKLLRSLDGTYAVIDSLTDLQELVAMSPAVSARAASGDTLVLSVEQKWGVQDISLKGHAADYFNSFDSALF